MDLAEDRYWWMLRHESDTWIRRHGSCRGSWDIKMLKYESGDVDLAENPWDTKMLRYESEDADLVKDPEIHMAAELWIRQHGSCRGSWDTQGCWDMNPGIWILQRSLRHKDVETWIRRCGSCRGSILVDGTTWIGDMTPAEDLEMRSAQKDTNICLVNNFPAICRGGSYWEADVKDLLLTSSYTLFGVACRYNLKVNLNDSWTCFSPRRSFWVPLPSNVRDAWIIIHKISQMFHDVASGGLILQVAEVMSPSGQPWYGAREQEQLQQEQEECKRWQQVQ